MKYKIKFSPLVVPILLAIYMIGSTQVSLAQSEPTVENDLSSDNTPKSTVIVNVIANDTPSSSYWNPATVQLVDPSTLFLVQQYVEPDQGVWTANADGTVSFQPCMGSGVPAAECSGALSENPFPIDYKVRDYDNNLSNPAQIVITYADTSLSVTLAYFKSKLENNLTLFTWVTSTEQGTAGFNLLSAVNGQVLNEELIESKVIDSSHPQLYQYNIETEVTSFLLEEVSIDGASKVSGPYELDLEYGTMPSELLNQGSDIYLPILRR